MINNVVLMGRLTAAPELKTTQNETSVLSFTLAVERRFQKPAEKQADFINCVAWRNTAEFISKYFNKGDMIAITGEIQTRKYEVDGNKRVATEIVVNTASFCGGRTQETQEKAKEQNVDVLEELRGRNSDFITLDDNDDLPF